jgi:hypothetical protein
MSAAEREVLTGEATESLGDLDGVAQVFIDMNRDQIRRRMLVVGAGPCPPLIDVLSVVQEGINLTSGRVSSAGQQRLPPQRGKVLCFINDDGVQTLVRSQPPGHFLEQARHLLLEVIRPASVRDAQGTDVLVELPGKDRSGLTPAVDLKLQVLA